MEKITDDDFLALLGDSINRKRKKKYPSQKNFADKLNISQTTLSRYEDGKVNIPVLTLKKIAETCDFEMVDYFVEMNDPSSMYKSLASIKRSRKSKEDKKFNEYMNKPENKDKLSVLYHCYHLNKLCSENQRPDFKLIIENYIRSKESQEKHLNMVMTYVEKINEIKNNQ